MRKYTQAQMDAARLVWAKQKKLKAIPGNCTGCGKPNDRPNLKTCSRCNERIKARAKERIEERAKVMLDGLHDDMVEKVETALKIGYQLKIEISKIREMVKKLPRRSKNLYATH